MLLMQCIYNTYISNNHTKKKPLSKQILTQKQTNKNQEKQIKIRLHQNKTIFRIVTFSTGSDTWGAGSVVWPSTNPAGNFWTGLDAASTERGTPSSLNSLLPENLLGNELN